MEALQKHVITMTLQDAYNNFKTLHPKIKIGLTMFKKLKPENVRKHMKLAVDLVCVKCGEILNCN